MSLLWGVGLAIGFILLQTKQTNLELGHQDPMLKDLISIRHCPKFCVNGNRIQL